MTILLSTLTILTAILWVWAFADIARSKFENPSTKLLWIVLIFVFPILGSILFFQVGKNSRKSSKRFNPEFSITSE